MSDQIRRVWELWMRAETEQQPLLLLLDDLQWGDLPSVQLVFDMLARRSDMPILVVAFARPEVRDTFPQVFAKGVVEIELGELSKTACEAIVRGVLGDVPSDVITQLAMRSTGNALFLEELLRHEGEGGSVPETLLALVESRVQEQPPEARRVLRAASILGRVFWTRGVDVLLGGEPSAECLETLADREIVTRQQDSRHQNSAEYTFRHALVRDAAYAMLTEEDRRLGHALAAKWLDEEGADEFVVARHLELAGDKQGAALKHARAAERLLDGNDLVAARSLVERTLASLTDDGSPSAREARLSLLRVLYESSLWQGDIPAAVQAAKLWVPRARPGSCEWYDAISRAATSHGRAGDRVGVAEVAALLVESTPDADAIDAFAIALAHSGSSLVLEGDYERTNAVRAKLDEVFASRTPSLLALSWVAQFRAMEAVRRALPEKSFLSFLDGARSFEAMEDVRNFSVQLSNVAHAANELGDYDAAEDYAVQSLALADEHGFVTFARQHLARAMARTGRRAAHAEFERVVREFNRHHLPRQEAMALGFHAEACLREGALVLAESHARRAMDLSPSPSSHRRASAVLARTLLATGRNEEALEVARVAMHAVRTSTRVDLGDALVRLAFVETSRAAGHEDDARQTLAESRVLLEERLRNIESPEWRIMYAHVEENARLLELSNE